jgi:hypothetical protein
MTKTAVGLFENTGAVDGIVRDLEANGFAREDIRVLSESVEMPGSGLMSTPHNDFEVKLTRDLGVFGVIEADANAYAQGLRRGGSMVFVISQGEKADAATEIMNRHGALDLKEIGASAPHLPDPDQDDVAPIRGGSIQAGRFRSPGAGARLFVW